jgi:hypothetical protein
VSGGRKRSRPAQITRRGVGRGKPSQQHTNRRLPLFLHREGLNHRAELQANRTNPGTDVAGESPDPSADMAGESPDPGADVAGEICLAAPSRDAADPVQWYRVGAWRQMCDGLGCLVSQDNAGLGDSGLGDHMHHLTT